MLNMKIEYPTNECGCRRVATRSDIRDVLREAHAPMSEYKPLYKCNARYFPVMVNGHPYKVLQSYSTNVALYSERTGSLYVLNTYSAMTTQHIWRFARMIKAARIVRLFPSSVPYIEQSVSGDALDIKCTAKQWRNLADGDFMGYVETL